MSKVINRVKEAPLGRVVDADAMAGLLGVTQETTLKLARDGRIPCIRLGRRIVRFDPQAVLQHVKEGV